ncbi:MAG: hypothetical protein Q9167_000880 [Letrouitia subvulpina]
MSIDYGDAITSVNGLGNLADELAVAWEEDGLVGEDKSPSVLQGHPIDSNKSTHTMSNGNTDSLDRPIQAPHNNRPGFLADSDALPLADHSPSSLKQFTQTPCPQRASQTSNDGGSDCGDTSPLSLTQITSLEKLACQGTGLNEYGPNEVTLRVASLLRDLGSQNLMETGITRFVSFPLDPSVVDSLAPLFSNTIMHIPSPPVEPLPGLHSLQFSTVDILVTLSSLADSLHMIRQTSTSASRKLKAAKDAVDELRREIDATKKGIEWIEQGKWQERLEKRESAKACRDVVRGFEELCSDWRTKIGGGFENLKGVEIGV